MPSTNKNQKYGIQNLDFLGDKFKIGYSTLTGKFQTKLGGYLTILMGLLSTGFFFVVMSQFFSKEAPVVMTSTESGSREVCFDLYESNLYLPISALLGPYGIPATQVSRYLTIKAFVDKLEFDSGIGAEAFRVTPVNSFDFKPCSEIQDPHIKSHVDALVDLPGFGDLISCPDFRGLQKDFKASISYITYSANAVTIKVYPCSLPDPSQCASPAEVNALSLDYGYPIKLLKPSDYKNPVESLPLRISMKIDPRTSKIVKEYIKRNRVFDDTMSLIAAKLKEEYLTLQKDSIDFGIRNQSQIHCSREEVEKGIRGGCQEYISFTYLSSSEILVTTRSYKKLTTMLGEFGGILKIITTGAFFVYGVYSMRKVRTLLGGIIFGFEEGNDKALKKLIEGEKEAANRVIKVKKIRDKAFKEESNKDEQFEALVSGFVSRRFNVDNLMQKLNLLELIEKAIFTDDEKKLLPLVLLKSEQSEIQRKKLDKHIKEGYLKDVQISGKESKKLQKEKITPNNIMSKQQEPEQQSKNTELSYKAAFENIVQRQPDSHFCRMIKNYMVSQLEGTFSEPDHQSLDSERSHQHDLSEKPGKIFKKNSPLKIELFDDDYQERGIESESPKKQLLRRKKSGTGFMRPTNSPMRIRKKSTKKGTYTSANKSRSSLNLKSDFYTPEEKNRKT